MRDRFPNGGRFPSQNFELFQRNLGPADFVPQFLFPTVQGQDLLLRDPGLVPPSGGLVLHPAIPGGLFEERGRPFLEGPGHSTGVLPGEAVPARRPGPSGPSPFGRPRPGRGHPAFVPGRDTPPTATHPSVLAGSDYPENRAVRWSVAGVPWRSTRRVVHRRRGNSPWARRYPDPFGPCARIDGGVPTDGFHRSA